jgi:hypothetical protein
MQVTDVRARRGTEGRGVEFDEYDTSESGPRAALLGYRVEGRGEDPEGNLVGSFPL